MSKHTPGPWVITRHPNPNVDVFAVGEVMDEAFQYELSHTVCYQNAEANARLIAAAPSMLHTLIECERVLARLDTLRHLDPEWPIVDEVRAQIAKATGK